IVLLAGDGLPGQSGHYSRWNAEKLRRAMFGELSSSVNGAYQHLGPQGAIARVARLCLLLASITSTNSCAISKPISAEFCTIRNRTRKPGCVNSSVAGILHQR